MKFKIMFVALAFAFVGLNPISANAVSSATLDQVSDASQDGGATINERQVGIQTFVPSATGILARVDVAVRRSRGIREVLTVAIYPMGNDGHPDMTSALETTTIDPLQVGTTTSWATAVFSPGVSLTGGAMYALALSSTLTQESENEYMWVQTRWDEDPYPAGTALVLQDGQTWYENNPDYVFKTYIGDYTAPEVPTPPSVAGKVNLIGTYGSVTNSEGLVGLVGQPFNQAQWSYGGMPQDGKFQAGQIDCAKEWSFEQILCDPTPQTNSPTLLAQAGATSGYTSDRACQDMDSAECTGAESFVVIDLGEWSTFSTFEVFQMHGADGQVTHVKLFKNANNTAVSPVQADAGWVNVVDGNVSEGLVQLPGTPLINDAVTRFDFASTSSRYLLLQFSNDGSYSEWSYIEVAGVKLFGTQTPVVAPVVKPAVKTAAKPAFSTFLQAGSTKLSSMSLAGLKKALKALPAGARLTCRAYVYAPTTRATAYSMSLAKSFCAQVKSLKPKSVTLLETAKSGQAPRAARGSLWLPGSYRVDLFVSNR